MAARLGSQVVDALLLGPESRRRQIQDFPVLGDVWSRFAAEPEKPHDLLIVPAWEMPTGVVAAIIADHGTANNEHGDCSVAYLQDLVVASLRVTDLPEVVVPATAWWDRIQDGWKDSPPSEESLARWITIELADVLGRNAEQIGLERPSCDKALDPKSTNDRVAAKMGLLLGAFLAAAAHPAKEGESCPPLLGDLIGAIQALGLDNIRDTGVRALRTAIDRYAVFAEKSRKQGEPWNGVIFQVTLNRDAETAVVASVPAIKADAARQLFSISCKEVSWAVIDSGIDEKHPAFRLNETASRVKSTYEFRRIRRILGIRRGDKDWAELVGEIEAQTSLPANKIEEKLDAIGDDRRQRHPIDWRKVEPLIELTKPDTPGHPHGTHVAGILGANWLEGGNPEKGEPPTLKMSGVCPDIMLYDFRVLGSERGDSEFAVSAALQFIRYLNIKSGFPRIHGVNMSLAIRHNVRNYACGRTPVCIEAEALVASGVVVVAAAGNRGYQQYQLADSTTFESYAASSITDPGNADGVITVGATHRHWPHTYGVSFFSSRGPTGDGRLKPDLLAPGERITSCVPGPAEDEMDGTSMAAPHVSGAAALLMARHQELKGRPVRIKQILCETATDLGRERSFQGHGMVDVLRAIQAI